MLATRSLVGSTLMPSLKAPIKMWHTSSLTSNAMSSCTVPQSLFFSSTSIPLSPSLQILEGAFKSFLSLSSHFLSLSLSISLLCRMKEIRVNQTNEDGMRLQMGRRSKIKKTCMYDRISFFLHSERRMVKTKMVSLTLILFSLLI